MILIQTHGWDCFQKKDFTDSNGNGQYDIGEDFNDAITMVSGILKI